MMILMNKKIKIKFAELLDICKNKRSIGSILKIFGNYDILPLIMRICINYAKEDKNERNRNPD